MLYNKKIPLLFRFGGSVEILLVDYYLTAAPRSLMRKRYIVKQIIQAKII